MKETIKKALRVILYFVYKFFSPKLFKWLNLRFNQVYSMWKVNEFKNAGGNIFFAFPLYLHGGKYISIGGNFVCTQRLRLEAFDEYHGDVFEPEIIIGDNVSIQNDCHIGAINKIIIGDNVLIASRVYISDHSHGEITSEALLLPPIERKLVTKGSVIIGDNVWLGEGVVILPGVTIGKNSIIGSNAVVTKSLPDNCVAAGNPAIVIKQLNTQMEVANF